MSDTEQIKQIIKEMLSKIMERTLVLTVNDGTINYKISNGMFFYQSSVITIFYDESVDSIYIEPKEPIEDTVDVSRTAVEYVKQDLRSMVE